VERAASDGARWPKLQKTPDGSSGGFLVTECPCGSGIAFADCCDRFLTGKQVPETAEQLMRARYTAYTRGQVPFLMDTLHSTNRNEGDEESAKRWAADSEWLGLEIVDTDGGTAADSEGTVEFIARFRDKKGDLQTHHEVSTFVKEDGRWLFKEGHTPEPATVRRSAPKTGRNDPCPCGSGKKFKKCCEKKG
jgi:SEC-C motif-containing protein